MSSGKLPNRLGVAFAVVCVQLSIGAIFGWSVFKNPLMKAEHWSETSVQLNFTLAFIFMSVGTTLGGYLQDRIGPRIVATTGGVLHGLGYIVAGIGASRHSLANIYLGYGLLVGTGMGFAYICGIATLVKWYPDKRGLIGGLGRCGYGFAAFLMSPFAAREIVNSGVPATFEILGVIYLIVVCVAAQFYVIPPPGWHPAGWEPRTAVAKAASKHDFTLSEAMGTWQFYLLFLILFVTFASGYMFVSQASPLAQELVGMSVFKAAAMVSLISIFNGLGALSWGGISDYLGRARVYFVIFLIEALMFFCLPRIHDWVVFSAAFALIGFCYGGALGTMPSLTADYFGPASVGAIYGTILALSNFPATSTPIIIAHVHQTLGKYTPAINAMTIVLACSLILPLIARRPKRGEAIPPAGAVLTD